MPVPVVANLNALAADAKNNLLCIEGVNYLRFGSHTAGCSVFYHESLAPKIAMLQRFKNQDYHYLYLFNQLNSFRSSLVNQNAFHHKLRPTYRQLDFIGGQIYYYVHGRTALIQSINWERDSYLEDRENQYAAGVYDIAYNSTNDEFQPEKADVSSSSIFRKHIGLNGGASNMGEAAKIMPEHITKSGETSIGELKTQGYQLFYLPHEIAKDSSWSKLTGQLNIPYKYSLNKKESKNTVNREMAARITASMQLIGKQNKEVCWTVQGSAVEVFTPALEQLKGLGYRKDSKNKNLGQQKVFFSNPIGSRIRAKKLVEELGLSPAHAGLESQMRHDLPGTIANKLSSLGHNLSDGYYTELAGEALNGLKNYKSLSLVAGGAWAYHNYSLTQFNQLITESTSKAADYALNNPVAATALMVAGGVSAYASSAKAQLMIKSLTPSGRHQLAQIVECAPGVEGSSAATKRKFDAVHGTGPNISERIKILLASRNGLV